MSTRAAGLGLRRGGALAASAARRSRRLARRAFI